MNIVAALRASLRRWPAQDDIAAVRAMTIRQWEGIARRTPTYLEGYVDRPGSADRAQTRAEWLAALPLWNEVGSCLEVGCGAGRNLAALSRRFPGMLLFGVDINAEALAEAKRILPVGQFERADLYDVADHDLPYEVTAILACGVIGHLEPTGAQALLAWALRQARVLVVVDAVSDEIEIEKGPRPWKPTKVVTGEGYALWRYPVVAWLLEAGAKRVNVWPLPEELRAPAATDLITVQR